MINNKINILLLGNSGVIGSNIEGKLNHDKWIVTGVNSKDLDFTYSNEVKVYVNSSIKYDIIIFLIGLAHSKGKNKDILQFRKNNYQTLENFLSALEANGKVPDQIIFASTISVYGEKYHHSIYTEDSVMNPCSPYAVTKLEAEQYLLDKYADKSWILRFAPVYSFDFLLNIKRRTRIGGRFFRVGKGIRKLSLCNIHNITVAVEAIIKGEVPSGVYNLSDTKPYSYNDLLVWQSVSFSLWVPKLFVKILYHCSILFSNIFLQENTIKLLTDNIYPNAKIRAFVKLPYSLNDMSLKQSNNL